MSNLQDWDRRDVRRQTKRRRGLARLAGLLVALGVLVTAGLVFVDRRRPPPPPPAPPPPVSLTFPEGIRREQMAELLAEKTALSAEDYLAATAPSAAGSRITGRTKPTSLEGFLFPATYEIGTETTVDFLVERQVQAFQKKIAGLDLAFAKSRNLDVFDIVTIASMVEREVVVPAERPIVAGVMYNRLRQGMRLDIDATVQYAVGEWRPLTGSDLKSDSPYNTRRFAGLPPGPIANPGASSIAAAAQPKKTDYLFYVAREDGTNRHYFARTLDEFNALVRRAEENRTKNP